jgi:hypothetical protein
MPSAAELAAVCSFEFHEHVAEGGSDSEWEWESEQEADENAELLEAIEESALADEFMGNLDL